MNEEILRFALIGIEHVAGQIRGQLAGLQEEKPARRVLSPAARKRIAAAQRKRWAAHRRAKELAVGGITTRSDGFPSRRIAISRKGE